MYNNTEQLMKKKILFLLIFFWALPAFCENIPGFNPKEIKIKSSIFYNQADNTWAYKSGKKDSVCYTKKVGFSEFGDYINSAGDYRFATNCDFDFIHNGRLIGYSNSDLKFYEFEFVNGRIAKTPLLKEEIQLILPEYKIAPISLFSQNTNSIRIKKDKHNLKLLLLNDSDNNFRNYKFSSVNSQVETYDLSGFLKVEKSGMIKFSNQDSTSDEMPIYVLLIR